MDKKIKIILFASVFMILTALNFTKKDIIFSAKENRYLQTAPSFTWNKLIDGTFNKEVETYSSDQFIFRDKWVSLNTDIERLMGKKDNGRVFFGTNQWLYSTQETFDNTQYQKNIMSLKEFSNRYAITHNIEYLLVPTKSSIMTDDLPQYAPLLNEQELYKEIKTELNQYGKMTNLFDKLSTHNKESIYYRTDHHWTSLGAYYAYETLFDEHSLNKTNWSLETVSNNFYGTDYRKSNANNISPDTIEVYLNESLKEKTFQSANENIPLFNSKYLNETDQYAYFQGGNYAQAEINGDAQNNKSLLLIKDSFANTLIPYLLPHYESITFVDLRYYNDNIDNLIESNEFTDILFTYNIQTIVQDKNITKLK